MSPLAWFNHNCYEWCENSELIKSPCVSNDFVCKCEKNELNENVTTIKYVCDENVSTIEFKIEILRQRFINLEEIDVSSLGIQEMECKGNINELITREKIDIISFNASNNILNEIPSQIFRHMPKLRIIDLSSNKIATVNEDDFNENSALVKLNLANNQINRLDSRSFSMLYKLEILDLSHNTIKVLDDKNLLNNNVKIRLLNLAGNPMESFSFGPLPSEANIVVNLPTQIKTLDITCLLPLAHRLHSVADSNNSKIIDPTCHSSHALGNAKQLNHLKMFNASGNNWKNTRKIFENLDAELEVLDLSMSNIKRLNMSILKHFYELKHLNLSHANIFDITTDSFVTQFQHLYSLDLSYNDLTVVNFEMISKNINTLNLEGNKLIKISEKICPLRFRKLNQLAINKNRFNCIDLKEFLAPWLTINTFRLVNNSTQDVNVHGVDCDPTARIDYNKFNEFSMSTTTFYIIITVSICFFIIIVVIIVCCRSYLRTPKAFNTVERPASYASLPRQRITNRRSNGTNNFNETTICNETENDYAELSVNRPCDSFGGFSGYSVPSDSLSLQQRPQPSHIYSLPYGCQTYSTVNKHKSNPYP